MLDNYFQMSNQIKFSISNITYFIVIISHTQIVYTFSTDFVADGLFGMVLENKKGNKK